MSVAGLHYPFHGWPLIARLDPVAAAKRVRRNHALEHATITVVSERTPSVFLRGRSNSRGFYIFGDVDTGELHSATLAALGRLRGGEAELAIHPRCGTNLAVAGILSGLSAACAAQIRPKQNRFSYAILASLGALLLAPQVGTEAQRHITTLAELGDLQVDGVEQRRFLGRRVHWISSHST